MKSGVVLVAHGSRREEANMEIRTLTREVQEADPPGLYEVAFMQFSSPDLKEAVARLAAQGVQQVVIMPLFLITGNHVTQDIPAALAGCGLSTRRWNSSWPAISRPIQPWYRLCRTGSKRPWRTEPRRR